jgi:uncharacterized membrane protein YfcA
VTPADSALVAAAGALAGALNAVAGGGTLVTFPALLATGMAPVTANVTSSVGLLTGYAGGSVAYRRELGGQGSRIRSLGPASVLGGVTGAVILLVTPAAAFRAVVPFLILLSTALLAVQAPLAAAVARHRRGETAGNEVTWVVRVAVFVGAVYGSYFGAGLGVLLLGVLGVLIEDELQRLNALKGLLSLLINVVGVAVFVLSGRVAWGYAAILAVAAYLGGTLGVGVARRLPPSLLRGAVVVLGVVVACVLLVSR